MKVTASALEPLWERGAEWERRLAMVCDARRFLYLSTYYIEHDAYGVAMLDALDDAQRRGVAVNLLLDGFGQQLGGVLMTSDQKAALASRLDALVRAGAVVTTYRPRRRIQRWLGGGHHVKIQVSDGGAAIFGSGNITKTSFEGWNEYAVWLRGPVVRTLLESYETIGGSVDASHLRHLDTLDGACVGDIVLDYWVCNPNLCQGVFGPLGWPGPNVVTDRLVGMVASARTSVVLTSFYFKPVEALVAALADAARRGVQVEIHHSHRDALPATELAWIAAAAHYPRLLRAGVQIHENRHGEHSKIVLVDDTWVAFGSYNFEHAAHDRLAEAMLASRDERAVQPARAILEEVRRHPDNVRVTTDMLRALPARLRRKRHVLGPLKRWM
ncbi:MAG: phosphatidylserine/phosphatidylglycerophosphate/cardiolipin synthase family protein [Acidobacteriota bacterium]